MKMRNEVKIGLITIVALVLGYIGLNFLKGISLFKAESEYYVRLNNLNGTGVATPVLISGYKIGAVRTVDFSYHEGKGYGAVLTLALDPKVRIPHGSTVRIKTNVLSGAALVIESDQVQSGFYAPGDSLRAIEDTTDIMKIATDEIIPSVVQLMPEINRTMQRLNEILANRVIDSTLNSLNATALKAQRMMGQLNSSMRHLPAVMGNVERTSASLAQVGRHAETLRLDSIVRNLNQATHNLAELSQQLRSSEGTAGKLINDPSLYNRLDSLASSTEALMKDLKANPKRYVHFSLF